MCPSQHVYSKFNHTIHCNWCEIRSTIIQHLIQCPILPFVHNQLYKRFKVINITRDDFQQQFLAEHSIAMLEQCCSYSKQCCNNVEMFHILH